MVFLKNSSPHNNPIKVAILGARGIGKVHARIFHSLGAEVYGILGTSIKTAAETAEDLYASYGFKPKIFISLEELLSEPIDAVSICTPPHLHFEQILAAFNKGLPVFCEKPLFWYKNMSLNDAQTKLEQLKSHPGRRFFMNAPNAFFLDAIRDRINEPHKISSLKFSFYTNGNFKGIDIGIDLFTHGLSILYKIFGLKKLTSFVWKATDSQYICHFAYGNCKVEFDFREDPKGAKLFSLDVDGRIFTRIQEGIGSTYNLYFLDSRTNEKIKVNDPFNQSIQTFIEYCKVGSPIAGDQFEEAEVIMKLMSENLIINNQVAKTL